MDERRLRARARLARREARKPLTPETGAPALRDPRDLFEYPRKRTWLAYLLWLVTGLLGGHRFYLGRVGTATAQFLTGGGLLVWWAVDAFLIPGQVREHNEEQAERQRTGRPPVALAYLGDDLDTSLDVEPAWAEERTGTASVVGDAAVLLLAGSCLGAVSAAAGNYRALAAVALLALVLNLGGRLERYRELPVLGDVLAWSWRLRLFYHRMGPGSAMSRLARPVVTFMVDPFRKKRQAEADMYLQLGGAVAILFGLVDVTKDAAVPLLTGAAVGDLFGLWLAATILTFVSVYAFAMPIGASLARPLLARRPKGELWGLTAWTALWILAGALAAG